MKTYRQFAQELAEAGMFPSGAKAREKLARTAEKSRRQGSEHMADRLRGGSTEQLKRDREEAKSNAKAMDLETSKQGMAGDRHELGDQLADRAYAQKQRNLATDLDNKIQNRRRWLRGS